MLHLVLYEPEIPPNTGNIIRLCANTGAQLHLVHPLGFDLQDKHLRRAGLDYHALTSVHEHTDWESCFAQFPRNAWRAFSTRGTQCYASTPYPQTTALLFGPESRGLPQALLERLPASQRVRIPMRQGVRSLNLANAVAIATYEVLRQWGYPDLT